MSDPELQALANAARRKQRLPTDARCAACGTTEHLSERDGVVLCYAHVRAAAGANTLEGDHVAGRVNLGGLVVNLRANDHRTVTELRLRLGIDDWPDANGDPLLTVAHFLAGMATLLLLVAEWLRHLAADAGHRLGPGGWVGAMPMPIVP